VVYGLSFQLHCQHKQQLMPAIAFLITGAWGTVCALDILIGGTFPQLTWCGALGRVCCSVCGSLNHGNGCFSAVAGALLFACTATCRSLLPPTCFLLAAHLFTAFMASLWQLGPSSLKRASFQQTSFVFCEPKPYIRQPNAELMDVIKMP
jgi:hypothetical protein